MTLMDDELRAVLRAEAATHRPGREAMLDRITRTAMRAHLAERSPAPRLRAGGAAVAVAAVLGAGGFAQWALAGDGSPRPEPASVPAVSVPAVPSPSTPAPVPSAAPPSSASPSAGSTRPATPRRTSRSAAPPAAPASSAVPASPSGGPTARGPLWSDGSIDPESGDTQGSSVVTVRTAERLTALEVTIGVTRTPGIVSRGGSQQVPGASVTSTVTEEADALTYRFVLSSGDVVEPGTYVFYARYRYAEGGRDASADSYGAVATTAGGAGVTVSGDFE